MFNNPGGVEDKPGEVQVGASVAKHNAALHLQSDVWKFEMNEFELEDFPQDTKSIFSGRDLDNNPVLWIRVDPDMEYVRKVKVVHEKRNNWLF